jgi:CheY-like chemotaxis protein
MTRLHVLVVDDEAMFTHSLRRLLQRTHDVEVANDGREALAKVLAGRRFDVILSDVTMPEMGGIELYEELLRAAPEQARRFVFLTGGAFSRPTELRLRALGTRQLEKPVDMAALRAMISQVASERWGTGPLRPVDDS